MIPDPSEYPVVREVRWIERPHGIRVPYGLVGPAGGRRMLFAHSLTASGLNAAPFFHPLVQQGWEVAALDQRGHGQATKPDDPARFELDELADDLWAVLDDLGWDTAWLAGGSLGAVTSLAAAGRAPERVEGMVLMAPAVGREPNAALSLFAPIARGFLAGGMEGGLAAWADEFRARGVPEEQIAQHAGQIETMGARSLGLLLEALQRWHVDIDVVSRLDVPVLVLAWKDDEIHPYAVGEEIATIAKHGQLETVSGGDPWALFTTAARMLAARPQR